LLDIIAKTELHSLFFQGYQAKRKIASFGYDCILSKGKEITDVLDSLIQKVADKFFLFSKIAFAELLITEYPPEPEINGIEMHYV
jgi:hypothetical protein